VAGRDDLIDSYLLALERELSALETPRAADTLYLGGGTPTHPAPAQMASMLNLVRRWFELTEGCEFTIEANPIDMTDAKIAILADTGVNRVSLGVQSFDPDVLRMLERDHTPEDIDQVVPQLRRRIANVSLDLIFGVPGQSLASWRATLQHAIERQPLHISTYGLTYEKGTAFWTRRAKSLLRPADEDLEREMYAAAMDDLASAGFEQYELSNFARPGFASRHNQAYWSGRSYFGFGPGAARYIAGRRETNHRSVTTWIHRVLAGESPVGFAEELSPEDRAREAIVIGLRQYSGVNRGEFQARSGFDLDSLARPIITKHVSAGLLEDDGRRIRLTREGRFVADTVMVDFL
jgi:oxygen-independent coproporphyrinogen-3 oxidase